MKSVLAFTVTGTQNKKKQNDSRESTIFQGLTFQQHLSDFTAKSLAKNLRVGKERQMIPTA